MGLVVGTELFQRILEFDYGDRERGDLMREVWSPTPWVIDAWTGVGGDLREREMMDWCYQHFGAQSSPIHERSGRWMRGNATIYGWTWFGFSTREEMDKFAAAWPNPARSYDGGGDVTRDEA